MKDLYIITGRRCVENKTSEILMAPMVPYLTLGLNLTSAKIRGGALGKYRCPF